MSYFVQSYLMKVVGVVIISLAIGDGHERTSGHGRTPADADVSSYVLFSTQL